MIHAKSNKHFGVDFILSFFGILPEKTLVPPQRELGNRWGLFVSTARQRKPARCVGERAINIATNTPSPWNGTCCSLSVNMAFNMQKPSLASPGFCSTKLASGPLGCVTGNIGTQLLITDKWVDKLLLAASPFSTFPGLPPGWVWPSQQRERGTTESLDLLDSCRRGH